MTDLDALAAERESIRANLEQWKGSLDDLKVDRDLAAAEFDDAAKKVEKGRGAPRQG
ncbi:MAG: hypothetical protein M5R36_16805 [Deltaproteobacteria bacterium]|nr:hypothetical protein [Deltaproteobacteria bacterium]